MTNVQTTFELPEPTPPGTNAKPAVAVVVVFPTSVDRNALNAMSAHEQAEVLLNFPGNTAALQSLVAVTSKIRDLPALDDKQGARELHDARMAHVTARTSITKKAKAHREPLNAQAKAIGEVEKILLAVAATEEDRITKLKEQHDAAVEAAKKAEEDRKRGHESELANIQAMSARCATASSTYIKACLDSLDFLKPRDWQEYTQQASELIAQTAAVLTTLHKAAADREAAAARAEAAAAADSKLERAITTLDGRAGEALGMDVAGIETLIAKLLAAPRVDVILPDSDLVDNAQRRAKLSAKLIEVVDRLDQARLAAAEAARVKQEQDAQAKVLREKEEQMERKRTELKRQQDAEAARIAKQQADAQAEIDRQRAELEELKRDIEAAKAPAPAPALEPEPERGPKQEAAPSPAPSTAQQQALVFAAVAEDGEEKLRSDAAHIVALVAGRMNIDKFDAAMKLCDLYDYFSEIASGEMPF